MKKTDEFGNIPTQIPEPQKFSRGIVAKVRRNSVFLLIKELASVVILGIGSACFFVQLKQRFQLNQLMILIIFVVMSVLLLLLMGYFFYKYIQAVTENDDGDL